MWIEYQIHICAMLSVEHRQRLPLQICTYCPYRWQQCERWIGVILSRIKMTYLWGFGIVPFDWVFFQVRLSIKWIDTSITNQNQSKISHSNMYAHYPLWNMMLCEYFYLQISTYIHCISQLYDMLQLLDVLKLLKCTSWRRSIWNCAMCDTI